MPIFEFSCQDEKCKYKFEKIVFKKEDYPKVCPKCGGKIKKIISKSNFILTGSGFYATDYKGGDTK